jgi:3-(3-hydroxy-phenyl)propionate hydroxylase
MKMDDQFDADVAIIGYGPTGMLAALSLAHESATTIVFEREEGIYQRARAMTVNDWTVRIFQSLGVDDRVAPTLEPQRASRWLTYDHAEIYRVEHPPSLLGKEPRFYNIYQPALEAELRACAEERSEIDTRFGYNVTDVKQDANGVTVTATEVATRRSTSVRARYAIAADGGSSQTRSAIGARLVGETLNVTWVVIDCRVKRWWPDRDILTFWSDKNRPAVDVALSAGNHRWEIPLRPDESPADYPTSTEVWKLLHALGVSEDDVEIHQHAFYQHHTRMADTWRVGRVFLAGDAAHMMPPWAGAGMQSGIRDAHDLGWKLGRVLNGRLSPQWLDTYEVERRPNVAYYTDLAVQLGRIIKQELSPEEQARLTPRTGAQDETLERSTPRLEAGWFRGPFSSGSLVGRMIPQPLVTTTHGRRMLLDDFLGDGFVLLGTGVDPATVLSPAEKDGWDALGARYVTVSPPNAHASGPESCVDTARMLLPWLEESGVRVLAVRPDRFIAATDVDGLAVPEFPAGAPAK